LQVEFTTVGGAWALGVVVVVLLVVVLAAAVVVALVVVGDVVVCVCPAVVGVLEVRADVALVDCPPHPATIPASVSARVEATPAAESREARRWCRPEGDCGKADTTARVASRLPIVIGQTVASRDRRPE
jgi:hypothetical protein